MRRYWNNSPNKYKNTKITVNGILFDSKREAARYCELLILEQAGKITELRRQVKYTLIPAQYEPDTIGPRGGRIKGKLIEREAAYYADFVYLDETDQTVVEDTKGMRTPDYVLKRKMMLYIFGIRVREI